LEPDTHKEKPQRIQIHSEPLLGGVWFAAWLFTIGFLHLSFWKGLLAILLWPYFLGAHFGAIAR